MKQITSQAIFFFADDGVAFVEVFALFGLVGDPEALPDADGDEVEPLRVLHPREVDSHEPEVELLEEEHHHRDDDPDAWKRRIQTQGTSPTSTSHWTIHLFIYKF